MADKQTETNMIDDDTSLELRNFTDWLAKEEGRDKAELRHMLDAYVHECNFRLARHENGNMRYFKRSRLSPPEGWLWANTEGGPMQARHGGGI